MKKLPTLVHALLGAALVTLLPAQPAGAGSASPQKSKIEVTWSRNEPKQLVDARAQLDDMIKRQHLGANTPAVVAQWGQIAQMERLEPWFINVDFGGGTLKQLLAAFPKDPEAFSFTVIGSGEPGDMEIELPPFSLHNAQLETLFGVVRRLLESKGFILDDTDRESRRIVNSVVCVLSKSASARASGPATPPTLFDSFPLGSYLTDQSIDDIVGAIRAGWELDPKHDRDALRLKFHPPTSILLVSGPPEAIMIASKVISQLKGAFDKDSKSNLPPSKVPPK